MVSHARTAAQRREQRRRAEARFAGRLCKMVELRHRGFAPSRALMRVMVDLIESVPQERVSERIVEQTVDNAKHQNDSPQEHISVDAPVPQDVASAPCRRQEAADGK